MAQFFPTQPYPQTRPQSHLMLPHLRIPRLPQVCQQLGGEGIVIYVCCIECIKIHFFSGEFPRKEFSRKIIFVERTRFKCLLEKCTLYNYIWENYFRAFSTHGNVFTVKKKSELQYFTVCVWIVH